METVAVLSILGINAVNDIRKQEIYLWLTMTGIVSGVVYQCCLGGGVAHAFLGLVPAGGMLLLSFATRGNIGRGDALILAVVGSWLGLACAFRTFAVALFLSAGVSAFLWITRSKRKEIPFVPFLLVGVVAATFLLG